MCDPFLIKVPEDVMKPLCDHNCPKSWITPKPYWLTVYTVTLNPLVRQHALVKAIISATCTEVTLHKYDASIIFDGVQTAYAALRIP